MHRDRSSSAVLTALVAVIAVVAVATALELAEAVLAPVLSAVVLGIVCAPLADKFDSIGLPRSLAVLCVLVIFVTVAIGLYLLVAPSISSAIRQAPRLWFEARDIIEALQAAISGIEEVQETVADALGEEGPKDGEDTSDMPMPSVLEALSWGPSIASGLLIFLGTFYFFLLGRHDLYRLSEGLGPRWRAESLLAAERKVSRYFLTITFVNAGFGVVVVGVMSALGVPSPHLWGIATFFLNFLLYVGPAAISLGLLVTGILTFDGAMSVVPMLAFIACNMVEAQFVTPAMVGKQLAIHPLLVFLSLVFWLWLWGPVGALVAVPLLVWTLQMTGISLMRDPPEEPEIGNAQR